MQYVFPDYYKDFKCIKGDCSHNCCIGWEIDIDPDTMEYYDSVDGEMGQRLKKYIDRTQTPHFILSENERCPFLNSNNLCDIIIELDKEHLCSICSDHPRFRNELPGRIETGIGLCCEAAAAIIIGKRDKLTLEVSGEKECEDEIIKLRDEIIYLLQGRDKPIYDRVKDMLFTCGFSSFEADISSWVDFYISLERLDDSWTDTLCSLKENLRLVNMGGFDSYMCGRETEFEQLLCYFVYRHLANANDAESIRKRAAFCGLSYEMIKAIGAVKWHMTGSFSFGDLVDIARAYSSEIEYSDENLYIILDELS